MRIRTVKPEFWSHPVLARLADHVRILALGILNVADDEGYFLADPVLIRNALRPYDEDCSVITESLAELVRIGYLEIKNHATHGRIGVVVKFSKHQKVNRPSPSKIKTYFNSSDSLRNHGAVTDLCREEQGSGIREQGTGNAPPPPAADDLISPGPTPEIPPQERERYDLNEIKLHGGDIAPWNKLQWVIVLKLWGLPLVCETLDAVPLVRRTPKAIDAEIRKTHDDERPALAEANKFAEENADYLIELERKIAAGTL